MSGLPKFEDREARVVEMGDCVGVDLELERQSGRLSPEDGTEMVYRCFGCKDPDACRHWLDGHDQAATPPDYCRNKGYFDSRDRV